MKKNDENRTRLPVFGSTRGLCFCAILAAMSVILGKFLQIPNPFADFIRISFENLPIILAGFTVGPIAAALVGTVADLIGCVLYGYSINPIITLGGACIGLVSGTVSNYIVKRPLLPSVILSVGLSHITGSVLIKSWGLAVWYLAKYELGFWEFVLYRLANYALVGTAECVILYILLKNRAFHKQVERMGRKYDL